MVIILFMLPGTPSIYYGDEVGLKGTIQSVEGCRYSMEWDETKWDYNFFDLYKKLSHLKQNEDALQDGNYKVVYADDTSFVFARFTDTKIFVGVLSKNSEEKSINIPLFLVGARENDHTKIYLLRIYEDKERQSNFKVTKNASYLLYANLTK